MNESNQRAVSAALESARPAVARLDLSRHPEENAADLIEIWDIIETSLRALIGGSLRSGQALIGELRQHQVITIEQAHALLDLLAVRERVQQTTYQPTASDVAAARRVVELLQQGVRQPELATSPALVSGVPGPAPGSVPGGDPTEPAVIGAESGPRRGPWGALAVALVLVLLGAGGYYYYATYATGSAALSAALADYSAGRIERARSALERLSREHPRLAFPHIYLARIARDAGDLATAGTELKAAIEAEPENALAQRELGALFLARGSQFAGQGRPDLARDDYDAARRSYARAVGLDPTDRVAQGFLGCALARLGRSAEAEAWFKRAGQGPWSACAAPDTSPTPGGPPPEP